MFIANIPQQKKLYPVIERDPRKVLSVAPHQPEDEYGAAQVLVYFEGSDLPHIVPTVDTCPAWIACLHDGFMPPEWTDSHQKERDIALEITRIKAETKAAILARYSDSDQRAMAARLSRITFSGGDDDEAAGIVAALDWIDARVAECRAKVAELEGEKS